MIPDDIITYKITEARACKKTVRGPRWLWRWVRRFFYAQQAYREAVNLARCLEAKHYPNTPGWDVCDDTTGVILQISNMTAGMKVGAGDVGAAQVGAVQVGAAQAGPAQAGAVQIGLARERLESLEYSDAVHASARRGALMRNTPNT